MMRCEFFRETILDYVSGNLGAETLKAFRQHFTACTTCAAQLRVIEGQEAILKTAPALKAPVGMWNRVQARIADAELLRTLPFRSRAVRYFAAAAAAVVVALRVFTVARPAEPKAAPGRLDIRVVDVQDRAKADALGRMLPRFDGADPTAAVNLVKGD